jgi:hypothetical protein
MFKPFRNEAQLSSIAIWQYGRWSHEGENKGDRSWNLGVQGVQEWRSSGVQKGHRFGLLERFGNAFTIDPGILDPARRQILHSSNSPTSLANRAVNRQT